MDNFRGVDLLLLLLLLDIRRERIVAERRLHLWRVVRLQLFEGVL